MLGFNPDNLPEKISIRKKVEEFEKEAKEKFITHTQIQYKKCDILTLGNDVTIVAIGNQVAKAMNICRKLKEINIAK